MATEPPSPDPGANRPPAKTPRSAPAPGDRVISVLLIDAEVDDYSLTNDYLGLIPNARFILEWASTYETGLNSLLSNHCDVCLLDYRLGPRTGIELLRDAAARGNTRPVILLAGQSQHGADIDALEAGADDYLEKNGLTPQLLERSIRYSIAQRTAAIDLERKVQERTEDLRRANEALREAHRRKDEFLSTLGHELRNPLAPILNALEIMRLSSNRLDALTRQRERIERQVGHMVRLVDELLDVSRITTGKLRLNPEPLTLNDVIVAALETSRPALEKARLTLALEMPPDPIVLHADRLRLAQVFSNLLNNAAKYTAAGGRVTVTAAVANGAVVVRVQDTGAGIPEEALPRVFDLFTPIDRTLNRGQGGLGVGLALVRRLVELHGGTVTASSEGPGTGAEFRVELPLNMTEATRTTPLGY